jgi:spore coat protein U-like protein
MKLMKRALAAAALGLAAAGSAQAQTATTTFNVTANVTSSCTVSATDLLFGAYTATAALPLDQTSTITVTCTNGENYGIDVGATPMTRTMAGPLGSTLSYGMYSDGTYAAAFFFAATALTGTGAAQNYTVYGRVPAGQFAARSGAHSDTVTVTVTY